MGEVASVAFSPDGSKIVGGGPSQDTSGTIKVWDATPRPFNASEWEEVDISGMEKVPSGRVEIKGLGYISSNYWKNTVTGELRKDYSTAGKPSALETIKVWDAGQPFHLLPCLLSSPLTPFLACFSDTLELKATKESAHSDCINSVAFSPDGKTIVSGSDDQTIKVWDAGEPFQLSP